MICNIDSSHKHTTVTMTQDQFSIEVVEVSKYYYKSKTSFRSNLSKHLSLFLIISGDVLLETSNSVIKKISYSFFQNFQKLILQYQILPK